MIVNKIVIVDGKPTMIAEEITEAEEADFNNQQREIEKERFYEEVNRPLDNTRKLELMLESIPVQEKPADRPGFVWKPIYRNDSTGFGWEEVVDPYYVPVSDGSYINPIVYVTGGSVISGKWYTDGQDIWEALKDGTPVSFEDKEFFDIIQ